MIDVSGLYHDYEGKGSFAVKDITFSIEPGEIFGFLGPSGAGKSTVQNIMTGILSLQKGTITLDGIQVQDVKRTFFNHIGYSFEHPNLYPKLTGLENLKFFAGLYSVPTEDPLKLLAMVGLEGDANKRAGMYSKGMKQRLTFARSIINNPKILFLDEPMAGLDPATAETIKEIIRDKRTQGTTIILTTHNMYAAEELCDIVAFLNNGKIVAMDKPANLKLQYGQRLVTVTSEEGEESVPMDTEEGKMRLAVLVRAGGIQTIHSREANLEQIFIQMTGRGLT